MKRDVLVIAHQLLPSDPRVGKSIRALNEAGARVDVLCLREPGQTFRDQMGTALLYRLPVQRHRGAGLLTYLVEYASFFALAFVAAAVLHVRRRYRVVVTHTLPDPLVFAGLVPRLLGARVVMDMHEFTPELYETRYGLSRTSPLIRTMLLLERWSCRFADTVVTVHDPGVDILGRTGIARGRIVVVMNSAAERFETIAAEHAPGQPFTLVYHGTLVNQYDLETVVEAMARMAAEGDTNVRLRVVGEGPGLPALRERVASAGLAERVVFEPPMPIGEIPGVLAQCDCGVVPMRDIPYAHVALPMKALECMSAGLPVITNPTAIVRRYFDERAFCPVAFGDVAGMAQAIRRVRDDEAYRAGLVVNACVQMEPIRWPLMATRFVEACGFGAGRMQAERPA